MRKCYVILKSILHFSFSGFLNIQNSCIFKDYIRTFTWDKKLEMVVKSTGILGGQGTVMHFKIVLIFSEEAETLTCVIVFPS